MRGIWRALAPLITLAACASAGTAQEAIAGGELPPAGYGSLRQDNVSIRITLTDIEVRFLPLDERLLRLLAPDAYESLHGLVVSRQAAIDSAAGEAGLSQPGLAMVTFFARRSDARFDPQNVSVSYRNQFSRPAAIVPYSNNFGGRQLDVRQQASAIYLFEQPLPVYERFDVVYGTAQAPWDGEIGRRIERERARVQSKVQAERSRDSTATPAPDSSSAP